MRRFISAGCVAVALVAVVPAWAQVGNAPTLGGILAESHGLSPVLGGRLAEVAHVANGAARASANVGVSDATAGAYYAIKTGAGWKAFKPITGSVPYVGAGVSLWLASVALGESVAKAVFGDGVPNLYENGGLFYQQEDAARYIWVVRTWTNPTYGAMRGNVTPNHSNPPADGANNWTMLLLFGYTVNQINMAGNYSFTGISGQSQSLTDTGQTSPETWVNKDGKVYGRYNLGTAARKFVQVARVGNQTFGAAYYKYGEADLPQMHTPTSNPAAFKADRVQMHDNATPEQLGKVFSAPTHQGYLEPVDPATIPSGATIVAPPATGNGPPVIRTWGGPANEGTGVEVEPTPAPVTPAPGSSPTPWASPKSTIENTTTIYENVTTTTNTTTNEYGDTINNTTIVNTKKETYNIPSGESWIEFIIRTLKTKAPFDWLDNVEWDLDPCEDELIWVSWDETVYNGVPVRKEWDFSFTLPFWRAFVIGYMIGFPILIFMML